MNLQIPPPPQRFRIGDRVRVKAASAVIRSLDGQGRSSGLPFMPQMVKHCGSDARVVRWVNNVCFPQGDQVRFANLENCVILDVPRCNGENHGYCQMGCPLIWNTRWLESHSTAATNAVDTEDSQLHEQLLLELAVANSKNADVGTVVCQATQLHQITVKRPRRDWNQYVDELNLNRVSASTMASSFCSGLLARVTQRNAVVGTCKRTPHSPLHLSVGDEVTVKDRAAIQSTLDANGKNRGLWFDPLMLNFCGRTLRVTKRISVLVDEKTGQVRQLKTPAVVLDDLTCRPERRRFCSRLLHLFWREVWLQRA